MTKILKKVFPQTIPVMLGYVTVGIAFGILVIKSGLSLWYGLGLSLFVYAGAMQFVAIQLIMGPFQMIQVVLLTLFVNIRHLFYGLSFIERFKTFGWRKWYMIFALTDETYSLMCGITNLKDFNDEDTENSFFMISLLNQVYWISGTLIGMLFANIITFNTAGIEFAMTALFVVIFVEQWLMEKAHLPAWIGLGAAVISLVIFGPDNMVVTAMAFILIGLLITRRFLERRKNHG